jgi:hypothetical protein
VPLSKIQSDILRLLAAHRNPESYVAGAVPINRDTSRFSDDIDVFHDREEDVAAAADADAAVLVQAGSSLRWLRREPGIYADLATVEPIDAGEVAQRLCAALEDADAFAPMPVGKEGLLFLKDGRPVQPDPANLEKCVDHEGRRRGHWPRPRKSAAPCWNAESEVR